MELEEMGCPIVGKRIEYGFNPAEGLQKIGYDIDLLIRRLTPRLGEQSYGYFLLERMEEDLQDAFASPEIWEECVMSARDRISSLKKYFRGEI